jgi:hypothetical protein
MFKLSDSIKRKDLHFCNLSQILQNTFSKDKKKIVTIIVDIINNDTSFLPVDQRAPTNLERIIAVTQQNLDQQFFFIHNCINVDYESSNCKFFYYWAPPKTTQYHFDSSDPYPWSDLRPQSEKNLESNCFWISLNKNKRMHRYISSMFLLGNNLEKWGLLRLTPDEILFHESWKTWLTWWNYNQRSEIYQVQKYFPVLEAGFDKIKQGVGYQTNNYDYNDYDPTSTNQSFTISHCGNFDKFLRPLYNNSLVEVINETSWIPDSGAIISEKWINSVYGYNLPIIISVMHAVKSLRTLEFDLFDDVIDHSYDIEPSPTMRLIKALNDNIELFRNQRQTQLAWKHCKSRMDHNVEVVRHLEKTSEQTFRQILENI